MRALVTVVLVALMVVAAWIFVVRWYQTPAWGVGTGHIAQHSS